MKIENCKLKIHFVGIGGIGVSALAQYYLAQGHKISGSDLASSETTDYLIDRGVQIFAGGHHLESLALDLDLVIYSSAVDKDNPELKEARNRGVKCQSYPQALGELTKKYFTIAVSGTHGKSTTTAMLALALIKIGIDPTVIIGTKLKEFGNTNFRKGKSQYLVIEADEWQQAFLNYWPRIIVLTNIEEEHMDCYKDLNHILETYQKFVNHLPENGILIANKNNSGVRELSKCLKSDFKHIWYGGGVGQGSDKEAKEEVKEVGQVLKVPGKHNVSNALAALKAVEQIDRTSRDIALSAFAEYKGSWRRFEILKPNVLKPDVPPNGGTSGFGSGFDLTIVSDYAHHPTEIRATLQAAQEKWPNRQIWAVFQPHQYQRTHYLFDDFVRVFRQAPTDRVIITDIYDVAGRENNEIKQKVSSQKLVQAIGHKSVIYLAKSQIIDYLSRNCKGSEVIVVMGAGDIYQLFG